MLTGKKVNLRPLKKSDLDNLVKWMNNRETTRYLMQYLPMNKIYETEWLEKCLKEREVIFMIEVLAESQNIPIGTCGLHQPDWKNRNATFGICIGEKDHWQKGCGFEASSLIIDYGFSTLNLYKINSEAISKNEASLRLHEKLGFIEEGKKRENIYIDGSYLDMILFGMIKREWKNKV